MRSADEDGLQPPTGRRREVLRVLRDSMSPLSIAQIAERLDVHPNTVRFHLDALADAGRVERVQAVPAGPAGHRWCSGPGGNGSGRAT